MDVLETLRNLVEIPSPSGEEDRLIEFLMDTFTEMGYEPITIEKEGVRDIVLNPEAEVWVVTHLDTVPIKRGFSFDGVYAYGTGVCDTKGSITSILLALNEVKELKLGIALLSDEEEGGKGSEIFVESFEPRKAIVMEPTSLKIANVHYGSLEIVAEFKGVSSHGSMPEFGRNAIDLAIDAIIKLKRTINEPVKFFVQEIKGGGDEYKIPDRCSLRIDFVFPPSVKLSDLKKTVLDLLENAEVRIVEEDEGFVSNDVVSLLENAIKMAGIDVEYGEMPSWTDAINLKKAGWNVVVFGPGELHYCHTERERIAVDEILKAKEILIALNETVV